MTFRRRRTFAKLAQVRSAHDPAALPKPRGRKVTPDEYMNTLEQRYAAVLEHRREHGEISAWMFEPISWRVAEGVHYRPDFLVLFADGTLEAHEVKSRKSAKKADDGSIARDETWWAEKDARIKLKVVAEQMLIPVVVAWQAKDGSWHLDRL